LKKQRLTQQRLQQFLQYLAETGNVSRSVKLIGSSAARVYTLRHNDPAFRQAWDEAEQIAADRLEEEAWRRAVEGFDEPVVSGGKLVRDEDGNAIMVRRYSDVLLIRLLAAHRPQKFDRRIPGGGASPSGVGVDVRALLLAKLAQLAQHIEAEEPPLLEHEPPEPILVDGEPVAEES
jgi:hypothetical protein